MLGEIQRLKEEANRFISILAEEDDPEKANELLSPGKRQSLTREVESLQVRFQLFFKVPSTIQNYACALANAMSCVLTQKSTKNDSFLTFMF